MKAVRFLEYGGQLLFNDVPTPTIARDEILVKINSTAVNHLDIILLPGGVLRLASAPCFEHAAGPLEGVRALFVMNHENGETRRIYLNGI